jgi:O-antigen ligase
MQRVLVWLVAIVPLVITPGITFYYDVIPRTSLLLIIVSAFLVSERNFPRSFRRLWDNDVFRWFCVVAAIYVLSMAVSVMLSSSPRLSIFGSTWRRYGLVTQLALLILVFILAAQFTKDRSKLQEFLRAFTLCGSIAAIYGVFQYFGQDPLLDSSRYHVGDGIWTIVRPPGTLGHANYFAIYLLTVLFSSLALVVSESRRGWRLFAMAVIALASFAIILTGSRSALVGGLAGMLVTTLRLRPGLTRRRLAVAGMIVCAIAVFYVLPTGERLRARVRWSLEDPGGGARMLLWRDSLRMLFERPLAGYGPETFGKKFPHFQSIPLARAYPDFHHESPHNLELDAFLAQGVVGGIAFSVLIFLAAAAALQPRVEDHRIAAVLLGCLACLAVAQQFSSLTIATGLCLFVVVACLLGSVKQARAEPREHRAALLLRIPSFAIALIFSGYALALFMADWYLARARDGLAANRTSQAIAQYQRAIAFLPPGASPDLAFSRSFAAASSKAPDPASALQLWQQAIALGQRAVTTSDEPANAAYNLAALYAAGNDRQNTDRSLRMAISNAPSWFKPHWMLARLLALSGRMDEAEAAAAAADERNGGVNPEVAQTLSEIRLKKDASR